MDKEEEEEEEEEGVKSTPLMCREAQMYLTPNPVKLQLFIFPIVSVFNQVYLILILELLTMIASLC